MESTMNAVSSSETENISMEGAIDCPEIASCNTEAETQEEVSISNGCQTALQSAETCLAMPVCEDESKDDEKQPLESSANDPQNADLHQIDTNNEHVVTGNEVSDSGAASTGPDLASENTETEGLEPTKTFEEAGDEDLRRLGSAQVLDEEDKEVTTSQQNSDEVVDLEAKESEIQQEHIGNQTVDAEMKDSVETVVDLDQEMKDVVQETDAEEQPVELKQSEAEDLDSEVEVLRDDVADIRSSQGKMQEVAESQSETADEKSKVLASKSEPEMMILDYTSNDEYEEQEDIDDLEVLDSWEEGLDVENELAEDDDEEVRIDDSQDGDEREEGGRTGIDGKGVFNEREQVTVLEVNDDSKTSDCEELNKTLCIEKSENSNDVASTLAPNSESKKVAKTASRNVDEATKIIGLEREVAELRSLVEKLENGREEDSREALLVTLSKKSLEIAKLNDTIEEIEENLQKVFEERNSLAEKATELEKRIVEFENVKDATDEGVDEKLKKKDLEIFRLKDELRDVLENIKLLENELQSSHAKEDMIIEKQLDCEEKVALLEIDLEYSKEKREQEMEDHLKEIRSFEAKLNLAREQLEKERRANEELRNDLKGEMKEHIVELKLSMESEASSLKKEVDTLRASELEAFRKLEDIRSKMEAMTRQNRELKADVKSKTMEVDAYSSIAQQLKSHILNLTKEKEALEVKICSSVSNDGDKKRETDMVEEEEEDENGSPEVITIDTDDQDSDSNEKCLKDLEEFHEKMVQEAEKFATKRPLSPIASGTAEKKLRLSLSMSSSSFKNISVADADNVHEEEANIDNDQLASAVCNEDKAEASDNLCKEERNGRVTAAADLTNQPTSSNEIGIQTNVDPDHDNMYVELQEARRMLAENEEKLTWFQSNADAKTVAACVRLESEVARLQLELCGMIETRDKLQPQLVALTEELDAEKKKVESLAAQLHQRTVSERAVLSEQQGRLKTLETQLAAAQLELFERDSVIKRLQAEVSCVTAENVALSDNNQQLENEVVKVSEVAAAYELERLKLTEVTEKFDWVNTELQSILEERERLMARVSMLEEADGSIQMLRDRNEALQAELSVVVGEKERLNRLVSELTQGASQAEALQQMVDNLKAEVRGAEEQRVEFVDEMIRRQRQLEEERDSFKQQVTEQQVMEEADGERKLSLEAVETANRTAEDMRKEVIESALIAKQLQQDVEHLRQHVENVETLLADKEQTVQELRARVQEFKTSQEVKLIDQEKVDKMKEELAETRRQLDHALNVGYSLTATVEQLNTEVNEKEKFRLKFEALELELADVLQSRAKISSKLQEFRSETANRDNCIAKLKAVQGPVTAMSASSKELKSRVSQLEDSFLKAMADGLQVSFRFTADQNFHSDIETVQSGLDAIKLSRRELQSKLVELEQQNVSLFERLCLLESELRSNSEKGHEDTTSKTIATSDDVTKELFTLQRDVERVAGTEALLNHSVLELGEDIVKKKRTSSITSDVFETDLNDAKDQLSKLTALVSELEKKCEETEKLLCASKANEAAMKESLDVSETKIEELDRMLQVAKDNSKSLQNRLQLSLTNGRRMESLLHKLQMSASNKSKTKLDANGQLQVVQRERDDLLKKLEQSENTTKQLKAKVISLALTVKDKQSKRKNSSSQSINLDDWEQVASEVKASHIGRTEEVSPRERDLPPLKSILTTNKDVNKQDENEKSGQKRVLTEAVPSVGSKKMKEDSELITKSVALNTITNSTTHSIVVPAQDTGLKSKSVSDTRSKEDCNVQ